MNIEQHQNYGEAVHAFIRFMSQANILPRDVESKKTSRILKHFSDRSDKKHLRRNETRQMLANNPELEFRVRECWSYILEIVNLSDKAFIEPRTPNGSYPDLVLEHAERVCVVEIKTRYSNELSWEDFPRFLCSHWHEHLGFKKLKQQVLIPAVELANLTNQKSHAYVLVFNLNPQIPFEPLWFEMTPPSTMIHLS